MPFVTLELPKRPYIDADGSVESVFVRRGVGVRQMVLVAIAANQVCGRLAGDVVGLSGANIRTIIDAGLANGVATLDGGGLIPSSQLPAIALNDTFVVDNQTEQLALSCETGDVAVRTDESKSYILKGDDPSVWGDWQLLLTPTDAVLSVFGRSGVVTAQSGDYTASEITNNPAGSVSSTNVQAAINELDGEKASLNHHTRHESAGADPLRLDNLKAPEDNTDLDVSTSLHGLCPKAPNDVTKFLDGSGVYSIPIHSVITDDEVTKHRLIIDTGSGVTDLFSAQRIRAMLKQCRSLCRLVPTGSDDYQIFRASVDLTISKVLAETNTGTVTLQVMSRAWATPTTGGMNILSASLVAVNGGAETTSFNGTENEISAGEVVCYKASVVAGSPGRVTIHVEWTPD